MVECPVCKKEINELDESCPYCHIIFDDMIEEVKTSEIRAETYEEDVYKQEKSTNADCLNFMANLNIILTIISAISIWVMFSTIEYKTTSKYATYVTEINWYGVIGGFGVLIVGFTLFFLLKTVADIYWRVEK